MSSLPEDLMFTASHEWIRFDSDRQITVGITDHAQDQLGDLVFVELPEAGRAVKAGEDCAVVESVKAASDIYSPMSGTVSEVNQALVESPELINEDAFGAGWMFRVELTDPDERQRLLDAAGYAQAIADE
jgi:glycine cleavage system H protein